MEPITRPTRTVNSPFVPPRRVREQAGTRLSRFVFTLNNYTEEEYTYLTTEFSQEVRWIIIGRETGESGTKHLQGACILGHQWSFSKLKTVPGLQRAHIECMRGKPEDSLAYCSKQDSEPFVRGSLPTPGKRSDLNIATAMVREGATIHDLANADEGSAVCIVKYHKGLTVLRSLTRPTRDGPPVVFWFHGPTGTGKTRCAWELGRSLVNGDDRGIWISSGGLRWFDGYDGHDVAIFDDFRAKHVTSFAFFLRLLDRYPVNVEFKGGFVKWTPHYIFVTCPYDISECFQTRKQHVPEDIAQLERRITHSFHIGEPLDDVGINEIVEECRALAGFPSGIELESEAEHDGGQSGSHDGLVHGDAEGVSVDTPIIIL